jgi:hypothetical protein
MNILFGNSDIDTIRNENKFTMLELDTIQASPDHDQQTAYCVLSNIPLNEIAHLEQKVKMHADLMTFYRTQQWAECRDLIDLLMGSWGGEVDSFYRELQSRLDVLAKSEPSAEWDGVYRPWRK